MTLFKRINQMIEQHAQDFGDAVLGCYLFPKDDTRFLPTVWQQPFKSDQSDIFHPFACYQFDCISRLDGDDGIDQDGDIQRIMQDMFAEQRCYLFYHLDCFAFAVGQNDFQKFCSEMNQTYPLLAQFGFQCDVEDGTWLLPVQPLDQALQEQDMCHQHDLAPLEDALTILKKAHPIFMQITQQARGRFEPWTADSESEKVE